jgi:hypothetical protein
MLRKFQEKHFRAFPNLKTFSLIERLFWENIFPSYFATQFMHIAAVSKGSALLVPLNKDFIVIFSSQTQPTASFLLSFLHVIMLHPNDVALESTLEKIKVLLPFEYENKSFSTKK